MEIDVLRCDRGWYALYIDGHLTDYINSDPLVCLAEHLEGGRYVEGMLVVSLGRCGRESLRDGGDLPDEFNDIPPRWWADAEYEIPHD